MIYLNFTIQNPWHNESKNPWRDLGQDEWHITKNKLFCFRLDHYTHDWFEFGINTRWRGDDHAGPSIDLRVLGLGVHIGIRDYRHWNYEENRWVNYDNPIESEKRYW